MVMDTIQQLQDFTAQSVFLYPIVEDSRLHNHFNKIIGFVLIDTDTRNTITISNGHPEGIYNSNDLSFLKDRKVYCYNCMSMRYAGYDVSQFIDCNMQYYLYTNQPYTPDTPTIINHYNRQYQNFYKVNSLVPLYKHEEIALSVFEDSWVKITQPGLSFYQNELAEAFYRIESNGINVNRDKFVERFGQTLSLNKEYCYTQYNFYTTTGRPSNRFGGINFAALNKEDETRAVFQTRYDPGTLVEIDFNSYHPRLIAQIIGYDFGSDNVYEHLACHYHNTDNPTQEQIEEAKEGTFRQLYGGIQQQYLHIPFFSKTNDMAKYLWSKVEEDGYIESPISGRRLILSNYQDITLYTLFNYFVQMYETETNVLILNKMHKLLENSDVKPVLYTYDSILFDTPADQIPWLLEKVIPQAIDLEKFPIKIKHGTTYKNLSV